MSAITMLRTDCKFHYLLPGTNSNVRTVLQTERDPSTRSIINVVLLFQSSTTLKYILNSVAWSPYMFILSGQIKQQIIAVLLKWPIVASWHFSKRAHLSTDGVFACLIFSDVGPTL